MPRRKVPKTGSESGFTLVELLITLTVVLMVGAMFLVLFKSTIFSFVNMQTDASAAVQLNSQAYRIATVFRGTTHIVSAAENDVVLYAYFYPSDAYVSLLHYYIQTNDGIKQVMADLTPMSANPPIGAPQTAQKRTFVIIDNYYQTSGVPLFTYLDSAGAPIGLPVADLTMVKGVRITLAAKTSNNANQIQSVQVSIRNRKTNL